MEIFVGKDKDNFADYTLDFNQEMQNNRLVEGDTYLAKDNNTILAFFGNTGISVHVYDHVKR